MMPKMPTFSEQDSDSPLVVEEGLKDSSAPALDIPSHEDEAFVKPSIKNVDQDSVSSIITPKEELNGIDVVALRDGFYNQRRISEGMQFKIKSFEHIGDWMKCINPVFEKKNLEYHKNKKAKK